MSTRLRPRLSRTLAGARWGEYRSMLEAALEHGYHVIGLEEWVLEGAPEGPVLVLRHDVDQHPRSALAMAAVELKLGIRSTWYLRWRTADPGVVRALRESGGAVGLHYETLSRLALERRISSAERAGELLDEARALLREEIGAFAALHGPLRSICAHGDSRVPQIRNSRLVEGRDVTELGVEFDANEAMRGRGLAHWMTDRSAPEGRWAERVRPTALFQASVAPILAVVHPNNWVSGSSLWLDRALSRAFPPGQRASGRSRLPVRTGSDAPPL